MSQVTCFAFLTRGPLPHAELWERWLEAYGPHVVVVHAADPTACPWDCLPDPAPTTWGHLGAAHRRMVRAAAQTDAARMVVLSDTCIPCVPPSVARERLEALGNRSSFDLLMSQRRKVDYARDALTRKPQSLWESKSKHTLYSVERYADERIVTNQVYHEQWYILARQHFAAFDDERIWKAYGGANLEVESYPGTAVTQTHGFRDVVLGRTTWVDWQSVPASSEHPATHKAWLPKAFRVTSEMFARKFAAGADLSALMPTIGI